tara:strand:- start:1617 stop:2243 length:627 start_codon:yes stop_codon:yes gene_type:complete
MDKSFSQELANSASHLLGLLLSLSALIFFLNGPTAKYKSSIFLFTIPMIAMYASSVLYHASQKKKLKQTLRIIDHCVIYCCIAGTASSFLIVQNTLNNTIILIIAIWSIAFLGICYKVLIFQRSEWESLYTYFFLSCFSIVSMMPFMFQLNMTVLGWMILGFGFYLIGVWFYLQDHKNYYHTIWHFFVILGSLSHFFSLKNYLSCLAR